MTAKKWMPALKKAISEMKAQNEDAAVEAICVSGNGPTIVLRKDLWSPNVNLLEVLEDEDIKMFDKIEQR